MKTMKELTNELLIIGATQKLNELNQERERLLEILKKQELPTIDLKVKKRKYSRERKHWTQTRKGKARLAEILEKRRLNKL